MRITRVLLQAVQKPTDFLPSKSFMHAKVRRPGQKTRFVQVASEIELLKDVYGEKTLKMLNINDETWHILMEMRWEERYTYLLDLLNFERKNSEKPKEIHQDILISTRNEERLVAGEMVYARNYHSLVDIYGADFRRKIDNFYGRNLMKQGDNVKKFIVDCRFLRDFSVKTQAFYTNQMQALHDDNWTSNHPFSIKFTNYQADQQLSSIAKRNLLFQYGPPSKSSDPFYRHPFAPTITSRRNDSVDKNENLLYISPRATRFLPDTAPSNIRGVVICLSQDTQPSTSSLTACIAEKVVPYQLPFKRVIRSDTFRSSYIQLWQTARIFREYFQGLPIDECIRMNINHLVRKQSEKTKYEQQSEEEQEKDEVFRSSMYHINNCSNEGEENPESMQRKQMKPPSSSLSLSRQHRNRHRGSSSSF